ncbi:MAG: DNA polymerase III subunit gamma/tau [Gammaproteobacteria bacterium]
MASQVLARKWRPKSFTEVIGQEHVLRTLSNAILQNRLHHAYLFVGTRGVGKTTLGRILAKCLNCETGVTATPCCQCEACLSIDAGKFVDLIEIDAASRTKVEDIRDILQNVQYTPNIGRYKIYLIDEVHMLSGHSFNALLKTLEEPPEHVKFFLATTDKQRLPITILSRCLQFNLKNVPSDIIAAHLANLLQKENIGYEENALKQIASAAEGSVRDALSILDQAIAYGGGSVKNTEVSNMLGTLDQDRILEIVFALSSHNLKEILAIIANLAAFATDFSYVLDELLTLLHRIALLQKLPECAVSDWGNIDKLKELAKAIPTEDVQLFYQIGLIGKRDLALAPNLRSGFEMLMLRMLAFHPTSLSNPQQSPKNENLEQIKPQAANPISYSNAPTPEALKTKIAPAFQNPTLEISKPIANLDFKAILPTLKLSGTTQALIHHCSVGSFENGVLELLLEPAQAPLLNKKHEERLAQALTEQLGKTFKVVIKIGGADMETPAALVKRDTDLKQEKAQNSLNVDNNVQTILTNFSAELLTSSLLEKD